VRFSRFFWFLVSILIGATAGLVIGWYLRPSPIGAVPLAALRSDYQTDYVLMVAQIFETEKDLPKAVQRLAFLKNETPSRLVQLAVIQASDLGYDRRDLELLAKLAQALLADTSSGNKP
jgi:hypothetical protein